MSTSRIRRLRALAAAGLAFVALGCLGTMPAEAQFRLPSLLSPQQEAEMGRENHPKVLAEFGGEYADPKVKRYVSEVGQRLARASDNPNINYTFTVLNSDIVNAFALPGGYIYVTRGLLALASSEAELAGVLGHEIGHVTARHTAQRYTGSVLGNVAAIGLGLLFGSEAAMQVGQGLAQVALASYSRDQEFESDSLGVRFLGRAGYDANAVAAFLAKLQADTRVNAQAQGNPNAADQFSIMQTHPRTADRVQQAIAQAQAQGQLAANPRIGREELLAAIEGLPFGGDEQSGFVRGRSFIHPALRLQFEVPQGFNIINGEKQVTAIGPNGAQIVFDSAQRRSGTMAQYLTSEWGPNANLRQVQSLQINGLQAAAGATRLNTEGGQRDVWLVAIGREPRVAYRFLFSAPTQVSERLSGAFRDTANSFRALSDSEAAAAKPKRVRVVTVRQGESIDSLVQRMETDLPRERFLAMNGLRAGQALRPGDKVKIVAD